MDKRIIIAALIHCIIISATFKAYGATPEILMQTSRMEGFPVKFIVRAIENSETIIDWGDETFVTYEAREEKTVIQGIVKGRTIRIYNPNITFLDCSGCDLVSLDVTRARKLQQLYCAKNYLEALDLTGNPDLRMFGCPFNKVSYLNINNCLQLKGMFIQGNSFSAVDLNSFFMQIPMLQTTSKNINLRISGNPGSSNCNTSIAAQKNWNIDITGNGKGGQPVTIETLLTDGSTVTIELRASKPSSARIDWGNGPVRMQIAKTSTKIKGSVYGNYIKIWCDELTFLKCEKMAISEIDISNATKLQQLYCGHNELERLDVSNNPKLMRLGAGYNHLKEIDISRNRDLRGLYIQENLIKARAIDKLVKQLPELKMFSEKVNLRLVGNPGADKANKELISKKNWHIDIE